MTPTLPAPAPHRTSRPDLPRREPPSRIQRAQRRLAGWLAQYSVPALRVSLGLVILGFGVLKFIPGASPVESLVVATTEALTFGIVGGTTAMVVTAALETFIGLTLLSGRLLRVGLMAMAGWLIGIMTPVLLFPAEMFPGGLPTLAAQYVLKDIVLATAGLVVAARALGARFTGPGAA